MKIVLSALLLFAAAIVARPALAAETTDVARISSIAKGSVVLRRGDEKTQLAGVLNAPVLPGDFVVTTDGARAEIQLDGYTMLRLGGNVQTRIATNDGTLRQVQLAEGTLVLGILHAQGGTTEIDTPSVTLQAVEPGDYRVTVAADGSTIASVRTGSAEIVTPQRTYSLAAGKTIAASGPADAPVVAFAADVPRDDLDEYSSQRDRVANAALNTDTYVPAQIAGLDDLNAYGQWIDVDPYGYVWNPNVPADWVPYRYGSWVWEDGFGWTWVALEPWGWVPYHYGRWFPCAPYGWCWLPPSLAYAPVWYPALVGFFGFGPYWGDLGFAYWGWVPLGPYEPFYPWYPGWNNWHHHPYEIHPRPEPTLRPLPGVHMRPHYGAQVPRAYANIRYGATGVDNKNFRSGNFSKPVPIDPEQLKNVTVLHGMLPMTPTAANLAFTRREPAQRVQLSPVFEQPRFAHAPQFPARTQFESQQTQVHQAVETPRSGKPAEPQTPPASDVWRRFEGLRKTTIELPNAPGPHQVPITTPIHLPPGETHPPSLPRMPSMPSPRMPSMPPVQSPPSHPGRPPAATSGASGP